MVTIPLAISGGDSARFDAPAVLGQPVPELAALALGACHGVLIFGAMLQHLDRVTLERGVALGISPHGELLGAARLLLNS
jgi:hypothetical protein